MIYFLFKDDDLVYIGKSERLKERLFEHRAKDFNYFSFIKTDNDEINELKLIHYHKPILNKRTLNISKMIKAGIKNSINPQ